MASRYLHKTYAQLYMIVQWNSSIEDLYNTILEGVRRCNAGKNPSLAFDHHLHGKRKSFGHNAWDFFGVGLNVVRCALERQKECLALIAPTVFFNDISSHESLPQYKPRFHLPTEVS